MLNSAFKTWLMVPCSRKKNCQTSAIRMARDDAAHGMNNSTRKKVRPGKKLLFRISASVRPSTKLSGTRMSTNSRVRMTTTIKSPLAIKVSQFAWAFRRMAISTAATTAPIHRTVLGTGRSGSF